MPFVAFLGLALLGPPELPPDIGGPPSDAPAEESPSETPDAAPEEAPPADEAPGDAGEDPGAVGDDEAIAVTPAEETDDAGDDAAAGGAAAGGAAAGGAAAGGAAAGGAAAGGGAAGGGAGAGGSGTSGASSGGAGASGSGGGSSPAVQRPGAAPAAQPTQPAQPAQPQGPSASPPVQPAQPTQPSTPEGPQPAPESKTELESPETDEKGEKDEDESYKKLGGFRLFRIGLAPKIGYTHGTSQKDGLFDRDKSIEDSINNGEVTMSGAGDLGQTNFGGPQWGFILDAEVVGINVWLDFHKFFRPGGMWSLLLGYDHEFGFGRRLRLDVGFGGGLNNVFLGDALQDLYYDEDNPESINIATLGVEGRVSADLHIKIAGPLYTGPGLMLGYHYLWSANAAEVTVEKGLHYSAAWSLRLDFAAPKLIGGRKKK